MRKLGWFTTEGRPGDRTIDEQLTGMQWVLDNAFGRTVLDVGCAEGLITIEMARRGAKALHGVEIVPDHVHIAREQAGDLPITFEVGDANTWAPKRTYQVVLLLAVLHKLKEPSARARLFAQSCAEILVYRTPPAAAPAIVDWRSQHKRHDIAAVFAEEGFKLISGGHNGPRGEWLGVYQRT